MNTLSIKNNQELGISIAIDKHFVKSEVQDGIMAGLGGLAVLIGFAFIFITFASSTHCAAGIMQVSNLEFKAGVTLLGLCPPALASVIYMGAKDNLKGLLAATGLIAVVMGALFGFVQV